MLLRKLTILHSYCPPFIDVETQLSIINAKRVNGPERVKKGCLKQNKNFDSKNLKYISFVFVEIYWIIEKLIAIKNGREAFFI